MALLNISQLVVILTFFFFFFGLKRILDGIKILVEIRGKADIIKGLFAK